MAKDKTPVKKESSAKAEPSKTVKAVEPSKSAAKSGVHAGVKSGIHAGVKSGRSKSGTAEYSAKDVAARAAAVASVKEHSRESVAAVPAAPKKSGFRKEFEPFRQMLLQKRREIVGDLADMRESVMGNSQQDASGDLSKVPMDMADVGSDNFEREFTIGLVEKDQIILAEIEAALQRMEAGTYFQCSNADCGKDIPRPRLEAKPFARYCIDCQKKSEKGQI